MFLLIKKAGGDFVLKIFYKAIYIIVAILNIIITTTFAANVDFSSGELKTELNQALNKEVQKIYHTNIIFIGDLSHKNIKWCYENINQYFNQDTLDYINARVISKSDNVELLDANSFPNAYNQTMTNIAYVVSQKDIQYIENTEQKIMVRKIDIVGDYESIFGEITTSELNRAKKICGYDLINNKYDYLITYIVRFQWYNQKNILPYDEMEHTNNLKNILQKAPPNSNKILDNVKICMNLEKGINSIIDKQSEKRWDLVQLKNNISNPTKANGAIQTINPDTGEVSTKFKLGYSIAPSLVNIEEDLNNADRIIDIEIPLKKDSIVANVEVKYQGYTMLYIHPQFWDEKNMTGWFDEEPIIEACKNTNQDVSGYQFVIMPPYEFKTFSQNGEFGYIKSLLICKYPPQISIKYKGEQEPIDIKKIKKELLGNLVANVPTMQSDAYVIGGTFEFIY